LSAVGDKDGRIYRLPSKAEWLEVAGLPNQALEQAWTELVASGILQHEVTSWHLTKLLDNPHPVGSLGAQTNQSLRFVWQCARVGHRRERRGERWLRVQFPVVKRGQDVPPTESGHPSIAENTGLRCLLVDNK